MTRKDFVDLAFVLRDFVDEHKGATVGNRRNTLALAIADYCAKRNPAFSYVRFLDACGVDVSASAPPLRAGRA